MNLIENWHNHSSALAKIYGNVTSDAEKNHTNTPRLYQAPKLTVLEVEDIETGDTNVPESNNGMLS
jgi:hypothetical protein